LPILPPVSAHAVPSTFASFHTHAHDIPCTRNVGDQNQVEVTKAVDRESDSTSLSACHPVENKILLLYANVLIL